VILRQSGSQHQKLKVNLQDDYTTGTNKSLKDRIETLNLLNKFSKDVPNKPLASEGAEVKWNYGCIITACYCARECSCNCIDENTGRL